VWTVFLTNLKAIMKTAFNRPLAYLFKTAVLICTNEFVALTNFIPASPDFGHGDFYWIRTISGEEMSVLPSELSNFCL